MDKPTWRRWLPSWPWILLAVMTLPAVWHDVVFPADVDHEFPAVARPTFSSHPPPAYRLAEPGDTIDRVAIYVSSLAALLAVSGLTLTRGSRRLWVAALTVSLAAFWYAATPGPTFDGYHGLGWRALADRSAPLGLKLALAGASAGLIAVLTACLGIHPRRWIGLWKTALEHRIAALLAVAAVLALGRLVSFPNVEPLGYWPRWEFVWALVAFSTVLVRAMPPVEGRRWTAIGLGLGSLMAWLGLVSAGIWVTWYHRPLERLREVVPGRIYISAMPTKRGLEIAQDRHHFKTIVNLFPEDTPQRSPRLADEQKFAREHGIRYHYSPTEASSSNAFLDRTLALARDPDAWPVLVHCHACMDRTPAWVGIYRFVIEGQPLDDVFQFIEGHRGYRPKASVTMLYNRVLPRLAPGHFAADPTARKLAGFTAGTTDPYERSLAAEKAGAVSEAAPNRTDSPVSEGRRPSLTPRR